MWSGIVIFFLVCSVSHSYNDKLISKGKWIVEKVTKCPNADSYSYKLDLRKKKLNRNEDGFDADWVFLEEITYDNTGVYLDVCKKVDGGCKLVHVVDEPSVCAYLMKYAPNNFKKLIELAGLEDLDCPLPKGEFKVADFVPDPSELPQEGLVGNFEASVYLIKGKERVCCALVHAYLDTSDDDDDDE